MIPTGPQLQLSLEWWISVLYCPVVSSEEADAPADAQEQASLPVAGMWPCFQLYFGAEPGRNTQVSATQNTKCAQLELKHLHPPGRSGCLSVT